MRIKDFYELVELNKEPEASLLPNLQYRTKKHPFFQPDLFIYIKCLYLSNSDDFSNELARLAPFITDRKALFYYVMNDQFLQFQKKVEKKLSKNRTDVLINAFFETLDGPSADLHLEEIITGPGMVISDYFGYLEAMGNNKHTDRSYIADADILETEDGISLISNVNDELEGDEDFPPLKHQQIIDRFIEKAASEDSLRIHLDSPSQEGNADEVISENMDTSQDIENDYFFTQTLANIYIKQKKYGRAYEIIKHLSLNYPEKSIYFADQLSFLGKLIKNLNNK